MAPEQIPGGGLVSEKTDIYALGLILHELAVGQRPFADSMRPSAPPERLSTLVPDVDVRLSRIVKRALKVDPRERPDSAAAIAALLEAPLAEGRGSSRFGPWLAGAALAIIVVGLGVFASRLLPRPPVLTDRDTIILAGGATNRGVETSAREAFSMDLRVVVVRADRGEHRGGDDGAVQQATRVCVGHPAGRPGPDRRGGHGLSVGPGRVRPWSVPLT